MTDIIILIGLPALFFLLGVLEAKIFGTLFIKLDGFIPPFPEGVGSMDYEE